MNAALRAPLRRRLIVLAVFGALVILYLPVWWFGNDLLRHFESSRPSVAHGTSDAGWLENGKRLPSAGPNFHTYSRLASLLGFTAVHSTVEQILLGTYAVLGREHPGVRFIYGETGGVHGGKFRAHTGHQNGTSVDLFVPVLDGTGRSALLPVGPWTEFGYWIDFDSTGHWQQYAIDFPVLADQLLALDSLSRIHGARVTKVTLAPELEALLDGTPRGRLAVATIPWNREIPATRHDEQFHVDFEVPGTVAVAP